MVLAHQGKHTLSFPWEPPGNGALKCCWLTYAVCDHKLFDICFWQNVDFSGTRKIRFVYRLTTLHFWVLGQWALNNWGWQNFLKPQRSLSWLKHHEGSCKVFTRQQGGIKNLFWPYFCIISWVSKRFANYQRAHSQSNTTSPDRETLLDSASGLFGVHHNAALCSNTGLSYSRSTYCYL